MSMLHRTKPLNIPRLGITRNGVIDWNKIAAIVWSTLAFVVVGSILLALTFHAVRWIVRKPNQPPRVITKTVYVNQFTSEQQAFITQCDKNTGVPDIHDTPWTCSDE